MTKLLSHSLIRFGLTRPTTFPAPIALVLASAMATALPAAPAPLAQQQALALRSVVSPSNTVPRYSRTELTLDLAATYDNPFNPNAIDVWGLFTSPKGQTLRVNGFLDQPFTRRLDHDAEQIQPAGKPAWKIRFAPTIEGTWRYRVFAKDRSGETSLPESSFTVGPSKNPGFIRRAEHNPSMFAFDNGQPYFAIGENMCWGGKRGSFDYDDWLPPLAKAGGNWIRIWMSSWNGALEWSSENHGDWRSGQYHGVGVYSLDNAWKIDTLLDLAETNGVAVMLCFGTYGEFNTGGYFNEGQWKANPYNATNGGPCLKPADFWTNATARQFYQQRLRYLTARYASRTCIQSWEFWNEANAPAAWVGEMARCLKGTGEFAGQALDPYGHLVTTTYGTPPIWRLPEVDFTQTHHYGKGDVPDHARVLHRDALAHTSYGKPHLMGEFGIDWRTADDKYDPEGRAINLHNGLWASALSGNAGSAMLWYWDGYVHPHRLYPQFAPLRKFADTVPWTGATWKPLTFAVRRVKVTFAPSEGVMHPAKGPWGRPSQSEFTLTADPLAEGAELPQFLYSPAKPAERSTPVFRFNFDRPGRFQVRVDRVSDFVNLRFVLDDKIARDLSLSAAPPKDTNATPEYAQTELSQEWKVFQARFGKDYGIDVPVGAHSLRLEVTQGDWISFESYSLTGYQEVERSAPLNLYGLHNGRMAILWAQNTEHNWKNLFDKKRIHPAPPTRLVCSALPAGSYIVEWWDTWKGGMTRKEPVSSTADGITLVLPELETDVAARIVPAN